MNERIEPIVAGDRVGVYLPDTVVGAMIAQGWRGEPVRFARHGVFHHLTWRPGEDPVGPLHPGEEAGDE